MDDVELEQYMSALPESRGIFASDELPSLPPPSILAVNLDPRHLPGSHWVVLYFGKDKAEYFDPLGEPPTPSLNRYLLQHSDGYMWNNKDLAVTNVDIFVYVILILSLEVLPCHVFCVHLLWIMQ